MHHSLVRRWSTVELDCFSSYLSVFKCSCLDSAFVTIWGIGMGWPYLWSSYSSLYCSIQVVILSPCSFSSYETHPSCKKLHSWWSQDTHGYQAGMFFLQPNPSWHYLLYFHYVTDYPNCQYLDSLFLVNHVLLLFHLNCLCAVTVDHQILHSSDPGFLQSLEKGHPTGIGLPLAELEPDGLDGMIAIQRGSNPNLPPIPTVPTVDEEHGSTLLEVLDSILQHAEGDEHLGSDGVSLHLFQMSPQYSRFRM